MTCSRPADLSNRRTAGWAKQPLLLSREGFGVTVARMFSAALQSAFVTNRSHHRRTDRVPRGSTTPHTHSGSASSTSATGFVDTFDLDTALLGLVLDEVDEAVERLIVEPLIAMTAPLRIIADVFRVADGNLANISVDTFLDDVP